MGKPYPQAIAVKVLTSNRDVIAKLGTVFYDGVTQFRGFSAHRGGEPWLDHCRQPVTTLAGPTGLAPDYPAEQPILYRPLRGDSQLGVTARPETYLQRPD